MELPNKLESVIADIRHQSETGKHQWYEVVYHDGEKWCHYAGSNTFNDGESVQQWKYTKDIFISSQLEPLVRLRCQIEEEIEFYKKAEPYNEQVAIQQGSKLYTYEKVLLMIDRLIKREKNDYMDCKKCGGLYLYKQIK